MPEKRLNRRKFLTTSAIGAGATAIAGSAQARYVSREDGFAYEITKSPEEWRAQLGDYDYEILRNGGTEIPKSSSYWNQTAEGQFSCKGCDLPLYDARWQVVLDKGWVFFEHSEANAVLTGIDWPEGAEMTEEFAALAAVEAHCRRCGGHLGHVVSINNQVLHCINGASLVFEAVEA